MQEGPGWRLGWDPHGKPHCGLVGGESWAIELTPLEFHDFCRLAHQLQATMTAMAAELMDEERLACEAESERVWLEVEGFPTGYALRLMLLEGRRCEGAWPASATAALLDALPPFATAVAQATSPDAAKPC